MSSGFSSDLDALDLLEPPPPPESLLFINFHSLISYWLAPNLKIELNASRRRTID